MLNKLLILLFIFNLFACVPQPQVIVSAEESNPSQTALPAPIDPIDPTEPPPSEYGLIDFYNFRPIIVHGGNGAEVTTDEVVWSSTISKTPYINDQNVFKTDGALKFRIKVLSSPGKTTDSLGNACIYDPLPYSRIQLKIGIRAQGSTHYTDQRTFEGSVNVYTEALTFTAPISSNPFIVDIFSPHWDYNCLYQNVSAEYKHLVCPYYRVHHDCVQFELEMVTSSTKDFN